MGKVLITGGAGFFGELLKKRLLADGLACVSVDLQPDASTDPNLLAVQADIRDTQRMGRLFAEHRFDCIFHCAAILAHSVKDKKFLWSCNVDGTRTLAELARTHQVGQFVFTSSNCLWGRNLGRPVREDDPPEPVEIYGRSKWQAERVLADYAGSFNVVVIRCPTILDRGRLGLLAILFEFIDEGRRVWVVGGGHNRYQFIYAPDLIDACIRAMSYPRSDVFHIGADDVKTFREVYDHVIARAGTGARVASLPRRTTLALMRLAHLLRVSPLGPYQYKMIAEDFVFDTTRIKERLGWRPTRTNEEMLHEAYRYFHEHRAEIGARVGVSAHKRAARMGVIRLLKWLS